MAKPMVRLSVQRSGKVQAALRRETIQGRLTMRVAVGYGAPYAARIHEDLAMHHNNGQAKFLEEPMRQYRGQMNDIVSKSLKQKKSLEIALMKAGKFLLAQSKPLVPVDTGFLRDSGYVLVT